MEFQKMVFFVLLTWACLCSASMSRPLATGVSLAARIQADGSMECWDALLELRACTGEVILFFLNGETYLGPSCCRAIDTIEHQCWPSMIFTLGFTSEEGDILRGYCDASDFLPPLPSTGP
ncbi:hypothetical protein AAC387_Pa09g0110 [Persea americana]